jgi:hypothetical protein
MPLSARDVESKLLNKFNFSPAQNRNTDHKWYELQIEGIPVISTKLSHGIRELSDDLLAMIARQLHVRKKFLVEMVNCTKSSSDYIQQVTTEPYPPFNFHF